MELRVTTCTAARKDMYKVGLHDHLRTKLLLTSHLINIFCFLVLNIKEQPHLLLHV